MATRYRPERMAWRQLRVGALLVVALAILAYGIFQVGRIFDVFARRYSLYTRTTSAAGLTEGAPVTLAGQRIGQVSDIRFIPPELATGGNHLVIRLSINENVRSLIRADSRASFRTHGLLGDKYIDIEPGSAAAPVLPPGATIPSTPPVDYDDLLVQVAASLDDAQAVIHDLRGITARIGAGEGSLGALVADDALYRRALASTAELERLLNQLNTADGTLARLIDDPTLYGRLESALARIDTLAAGILAGQGTLGRLARDTALYERALGTFGRVDTALAGFAGLLDVAGNAEGTLQRLLTDPHAYDQLLKAIVDLQNLIADIRQNPRRYSPEIRVDIF